MLLADAVCAVHEATGTLVVVIGAGHVVTRYGIGALAPAVPAVQEAAG